jgi:hypothetical protein
LVVSSWSGADDDNIECNPSRLERLHEKSVSASLGGGYTYGIGQRVERIAVTYTHDEGHEDQGTVC